MVLGNYSFFFLLFKGTKNYTIDLGNELLDILNWFQNITLLTLFTEFRKFK